VALQIARQHARTAHKLYAIRPCLLKPAATGWRHYCILAMLPAAARNTATYTARHTPA